MAVVELPVELGIKLPLFCSICQVKLLLLKATVGLLDANSHQAFACVSHFMEPDLLIRGWADFIARERTKYLRQKQLSGTSIYEGWLDARPYS